MALNLAIDATNLRGGGGVTHLVELLSVFQPAMHGFNRIVIWGSAATLRMIEDKPWIDKRNPPELDKGFLLRTFWQVLHLSQSVREARCDILFVPGGSYAGNFKPIVTMSQNLLPFEILELRRYGWTFFTLKLLLLRLTQSLTFRKADGIIFLTKYARDIVLRVIDKCHGQTCLVPHGLNPRFSQVPKEQHPINNYDDENPYRVLYVSVIDQYKHQWHVVEAIATLRKQGFPISLDLVGPAYPAALQRLDVSIDQCDPDKSWIFYHGSIPFSALHYQYMQANLGLFASSCENMPNILLEMMASGLPIACSNRGPMPEVLGAGGVYFDPENTADVARALLELIESPQLRTEIAIVSHQSAKQYSWQRCADETFGFLSSVAQEYKGVCNV
jgi:glycosyltransferase involved in cell wall biosynthesis